MGNVILAKISATRAFSVTLRHGVSSAANHTPSKIALFVDNLLNLFVPIAVAIMLRTIGAAPFIHPTRKYLKTQTLLQIHQKIILNHPILLLFHPRHFLSLLRSHWSPPGRPRPLILPFISLILMAR